MRTLVFHMLHCIFYRLNKSVLGALLFIAIVMACGNHSMAFAEDVLKIGGVGSALPSMQLVAEAFEKSHPGVKVQIVPSLGSAAGIKAVLNGALDVGLSGKPIKDDERGKVAIGTVYAKTPFILVTHKKTAESGLSTKELVEIYEGKRQTWTDGTRIRLVLRPESDVDTTIIKRISPEMEQAVKAALSRKGMIIAITNQDNDDVVENTPGSLGTSTLAQVIPEKHSLKILSFNGVQPNVKALAEGTYPLVKYFYIVTTSRESALAKQFISFVYSPTGSKILSENGMVPIDRARH